MTSLVVLALVSAPPLALGWRIQDALPGERRAGSSLLLSSGFGFGATGLAVAGVGLAGGLTRVMLAGVLALEAAAAGPRAWRGLARALRSILRGLREGLRDPRWAGPAAVSAGTLGLAGLVSRAPLSGSDAMAYHFAIPQLYANAGRIFDLPSCDYSYLLGTGHMLILLGLGIAGPALALGLCWLPAVLVALATWEMAKGRIPAPSAAIAVAATVSAPLLFWQMSAAGAPDLWTTLFALLAAISVLEFRAAPRLPWAAAAGAFAGLAAGCKYTALSLVALAAMMIAVRERKLGKAFFLFAAMAVVAGSWHFFLNFAWTGNPIHPFSLLSPSGLRPLTLSARTTVETSRAPRFSLSPAALLAYPIRLTVEGHEWGLGEMFGPVALTLLPVVLVRAWREREFDLLLFAGGFVAFNAATSQMARFLLPVYPIFIVLAIEALVWLRRSAGLPKTAGVALAAVMVSLAWAVASDALYSRPFLRAAVEPARREEFLRQWASDYEISAWLNRRLGSAAGRVMVFYRHVYYLAVPYVSGDPSHSALMDPGAIRSGTDLSALLSRLSVVWVAEDDRFPDPVRPSFEELAARGELRRVDTAEVEDVAGNRGMNRYRKVRLSLWRFEPAAGTKR